MLALPTTKPCRPSTTAAEPKALCRRSSLPMPSRMPSGLRPPCPRTRSFWSTCRAGVTKTCIPLPNAAVLRCRTTRWQSMNSPNNRLAAAFAKTASRAALIPYITSGEPSMKATPPLMHALVKAGADIIELGVPFSDPMADGPVIQRAGQRAIERGVGLKQVLEMVAEFRRQDNETPVVLMGYANPVERMGQQKFVESAAAAG